MVFSLTASLNYSDIVLRATHHHTSRLINCKLLFCKTQHKNNINRLQIKEEIRQCYELINRLGKRSCISSEKVLYKLFLFFSPEVSLQIANLLDCTTWSGAEPGLMDAVTRGALLAGKPVGGFKIGKEAGEWAASKFHPYHQKITLPAGDPPQISKRNIVSTQIQ
ncbi:hypothetical protein QL285_060905 [Trifolium repens]|nr:hypothetical protein QL285_060905 [Trifolium repens]